MNRGITLIILFCVHQLCAQSNSSLYRTLWQDQDPEEAIRLSNTISADSVDAFVIYCRSIAFCLTGKYQKAKTNLSILLQESSLNSSQKAKINLAKLRCQYNCQLSDFPKDFYPEIRHSEHTVQTFTHRMTTNTNAGSVVQTQHNKYMTSYHKGMRHISTVGSIDHTRLGDISYRVFEDFNKENIRIRLPKFSERRTFQMFENQYFRIVSFTTKQWTLGDIQERETVLNSALLFFELEYEMVLPELPTTLYIVENTDQLKKVAKELHNYIIPENSIGYSSMTDQSVVVVTPNFYLGTINHEMVHILLDYSDQKLPGWMEEGLASAYEVSYFDTLELPLDKLPFGYKERLRNRHSERWYNDGRYRDSLHEERLRRDYGYRERWYRDQTRFDFPSGQNRYLDRYDYFYNDQDIIKVPILKPAHNWRHVWLEGYMTQDLGISLKPWNFYYLEKTARKRLIKRLETFSDDRTFYGHLDNERVDVVQQSINIALARYLVMSFLRTENSLREYHFGDLNYRLREEIELIHYRPDRFVEWYIETYWDEPDRTNEDNFEFYRERLEGY